ncbi:MAG: DUF86 domain-containing protein [Deltaproteobacteria bacterium]|nr:DUF86 domain-containing protein [Deltaproteobacteria bacterium]
MVFFEKVIYKFQQLDEYLGLLKIISRTPEEQFLKDKILMGSAKYYLQVSIECCLDVANHIIASEKFRPPTQGLCGFVYGYSRTGNYFFGSWRSITPDGKV